ncbi:derlin-2 [Cavenderia fasciculata]|uniref:Derlin n=1 Tax=Cavenderia fasciculata TaxID=261658 RepID=F4PRA7_CACFS|nr:derlin-2 [Cavenderia fasciculata]EGG21307.1 derlin-2 [Cavenderia fasciculata]|eukprot:XP_004359157.1 derlin-2 [Cavenderia fasciculata]
MAAPFEQWYRSVPIVTRVYMTGCVVTTALVSFDLITPFDLYLNFPLIMNKYEVWRLLTNFLFFDVLTLNFVLHIVRNSKLLEEGSFRGRSADYIYMFLFGIISLLVCLHTSQSYPYISMSGFLYYTKIFNKTMFLGPALELMVVYVWSRRNPNIVIHFFGLFTFSAPFYPWVILGISYLLKQSIENDIMGIIVGHIYYYLEDVYPTISGRRLLQTPGILKYFINDQPGIMIDGHLIRDPELIREIQEQREREQQQELELYLAMKRITNFMTIVLLLVTTMVEISLSSPFSSSSSTSSCCVGTLDQNNNTICQADAPYYDSFFVHYDCIGLMVSNNGTNYCNECKTELGNGSVALIIVVPIILVVGLFCLCICCCCCKKPNKKYIYTSIPDSSPHPYYHTAHTYQPYGGVPNNSNNISGLAIPTTSSYYTPQSSSHTSPYQPI